MTVLVTGATGTVGGHTVQHLLRAGRKVRALTRDPARARLPEGVDVVAGDLTDAATLTGVFDGVTAVHLINFGQDYRPLANGQEIADLLVRAGVRRVTVLGGWEEGTLEPAIRSSTLEWTDLKPIEFMSNTLTDWGERLRTGGVIREPYGNRKSAPVHESDIGAVAAVALTEDGHAGQTYALTGPEVLTPRDKIRVLSEVTGRDLRFEELTPDQTRKEWVEEGTPPDMLLFKVFGDPPRIGRREMVDFLLRIYGTEHEVGSTPNGTVQKVTGRQARTFAQWAREHADGFRA
ncbi:SDR family oxidoreductase [Sphaerisporangium corydalis]|uniref:SDR family oxidoreductase n=1 Tax=Sphaerisporangium corydalis TaxID=1441875 RepID=A0ABV9EJF9_9ACTN|nr:NmrA family NAD(P)-binding protein [Sphaerisporangium corydalis]